MIGRLAAAPVFAAAALAAGCAVAAEPVVVYDVKAGDSLYALAGRYFIRLSDYREVQRRNHVRQPRRMPVGLKLEVPTRVLRTEPVEARLGAFRGPVNVSTAGRAAAASAGLLVREGDLVATGANAFARIDMPDGSRVALPSQSRVRVERLRRTLLTGAVDRAFVVEAGRGESTVTPLPTPQDRYIVRTPMSVSAVRGTEFHVRYDPERHSAATEVVSGLVAVTADQDRSASVPAAYGVAVGASGALHPTPLPAAPALLRPDKAQDEPKVVFDVAPVAEARGYRIRLAADAGFLDAFAEATADGPQVVFEGVPDGDYFARVSVIGPEDLEGMPRTYAFERFLNTLDLSPMATSKRGRERRYLFRWTAGGNGERTYRYQLSRDGAATPVVDEAGLSETQITVTDLPPGAYVWRVMSRTFAKGRHIDKWSPPQTFQIGR
ncbi:peptidoglycan-binding protein [Caulobacter sp. CCUG 60055]|uniref:FecR domain-containing protein n=1 Tax=Caulobacter sp. CCUG 60055 TaxID=2100090 RepID=UPI001FA80523|nr:FecR domain-containing protein [Caulobacter sp. CCUG 60055]MCI3180361.1 peptidoglycan-binding protein [Caulobacter sp. CCUG 60055]